jgi:hypothetical protein
MKYKTVRRDKIEAKKWQKGGPMAISDTAFERPGLIMLAVA